MSGNHEHSWQIPGRIIETDQVLDDWLGATQALITCPDCGCHALMYLVAWQGTQLAERIFAVRTLADDAWQTWQHNISRDYCDLSRKQSETEALINSASSSATLVAVTLPDLCVRQASVTGAPPPVQHWREIEESAYPAWREKLGPA